MNNTPNIIKYHKQYWASFQYCVEMLGVTADAVERAMKPDRKGYAKIKINHHTYILISSIPRKELLGNERFFEQVCEVVYDQNVIQLRNAFKEACYYATECNNADWYEYQSGFKINREKAKEIDQYGNILLQIKTFPFWKFNVQKMEFYTHALEIGRELCPMFIFKNEKSIINKLKQLPEDKEELKIWLVPGYYSNQNKRIWNRDENRLVNTNTGEVADIDIHAKIAFKYWINPGKGNKLNKRQVYDNYKAEIEAIGIEPVAISTMKKYINEKRMFLSIERDGKVAFNDKYGVYIPAEKLKYSGSQWSADYSGSKLGYWGKDKDGNPKVKTLYVLRIMDTFSGKWLGFSVSDRGESKATTLQGLNNAIAPLQKTAFELVTDNGSTWGNPFNKEDEMTLRLSKLFVKHRRISLGNKQANPAENLVRRVSELSREFDNWIMLGFNSSFSRSNNNTANPDYAGNDILNSKEEAIEQLYLLQERWNNEKDLHSKKSRIELYAENQHPELADLTPENRFFSFANHTKVSVAESRGLIIVKSDKIEQKYQFDDFGTALQTIAPHCTTQDLEVIVAFTAEEAHLYSVKGDYIMQLQRAKLAHKSFAEMTKASFENLNEHFERKHHFKQSAEQLTEQVADDEFTTPMNYMLEVSLNKNGKKQQEHATEQRIDQLTGMKDISPQKVQEEVVYEEEDMTEFIKNRLYDAM